MESAVVIVVSPTAELDRLGDEIAELSAHLEAATARLLDLIREFDARGGWNTGFRSCAEWLSWRVGLDLGAAREKVRVARALGQLPRVAAALARGEISYSKVRAITRVAETEDRLLAVARAGTASHVERIVRGWRRVDRLAEAREAERRHASRGLQVYEDEDGMVIHVDAPALADPDAPGQSVVEGGAHVPAETCRRLACDAHRVVMRHDGDGRVLDVGRRTRTIPPALRLALRHRDRGCRFPGLRRPLLPGPPHPALGQRRRDPAGEPHIAVPGPSPGGPRGGVSDRAAPGRGPPLPAAERVADPRGAAAEGRSRGSGRGAARAAPSPRPRDRRADGVSELGRGAARSRLGDRRATAGSGSRRACDHTPTMKPTAIPAPEAEGESGSATGTAPRARWTCPLGSLERPQTASAERTRSSRDGAPSSSLRRSATQRRTASDSEIPGRRVVREPGPHVAHVRRQDRHDAAIVVWSLAG